MKKTILKSKLVLHKETIGELAGRELSIARGGQDAAGEGCTGVTRLASGCPGVNVQNPNQ